MTKYTTIVAISLFVVLSGCAGQPEPAATQAPAATPAPAAVATPPDETAAVAAVKEITEAQSGYFQRNRRYALAYDELIAAHFLTAEPTVEKSGYEIRMRPSPDAARFTVSATPASPSATARHLFADQTGEIHAEAGKEATASSPIL